MKQMKVDGKLGKRRKSFARAQVLGETFVMDKPVQDVRSHAGLFLALGTGGSWEGGAALGFQAGRVPWEGGVMAHFWLGW